nr:hypothetical protein GCM10011355_10450 [Aquisalinus luteolus]
MPQGTATAQGSSSQGSSSQGVPAAPYTSTPRYDSQYPDYWESVQEGSASGGDLARAQRDGLVVTDGAAMPSRPRQQQGQSQGQQQVQGYGSQHYAGTTYTDPAGLAPPPVQQAPQRATASQPAYASDEIPEAPVSTPAYGGRSAVPQRGSDGLPVYGETQEDTLPPRSAPPVPQSVSPQAVMPAPGGRYGLHLASYRVIDNAYSGWDILLGRHTDELGILEPRIAAEDIPGLGLHYRLKAGPLATREEAISLCERIKAGGDYCAVMAFDGEPL